MKTKLDYYKIFYETARHSSFSLAARELYISQSAISQCIVRLEEDLNTQLFIRTRKGVRLTREGNLLFQRNTSFIYRLICFYYSKSVKKKEPAKHAGSQEI